MLHFIYCFTIFTWLHVRENYMVLPLPTSWILHINYLNCLGIFSLYTLYLYVVHHIYMECYYIQESKDSSEVTQIRRELQHCSTVIHFSLHKRNSYSAFPSAVCLFGWSNLNQSLQNVILSGQSVLNK